MHAAWFLHIYSSLPRTRFLHAHTCRATRCTDTGRVTPAPRHGRQFYTTPRRTCYTALPFTHTVSVFPCGTTPLRLRRAFTFGLRRTVAGLWTLLRTSRLRGCLHATGMPTRHTGSFTGSPLRSRTLAWLPLPFVCFWDIARHTMHHLHAAHAPLNCSTAYAIPPWFGSGFLFTTSRHHTHTVAIYFHRAVSLHWTPVGILVGLPRICIRGSIAHPDTVHTAIHHFLVLHFCWVCTPAWVLWLPFLSLVCLWTSWVRTHSFLLLLVSFFICVAAPILTWFHAAPAHWNRRARTASLPFSARTDLHGYHVWTLRFIRTPNVRRHIFWFVVYAHPLPLLRMDCVHDTTTMVHMPPAISRSWLYHVRLDVLDACAPMALLPP